MDPELQLFLRDRIEEVAGAAAQVADFASRYGADEKAQFNLQLAVDELLTNVVSYGFPEDEGRHVHIHLTARHHDGHLHIVLDDTGKPFNPLELPLPDTDAPLAEREVGGLGIHFVRSLMHDVDYRREHGHNITVLRYDL